MPSPSSAQTFRSPKFEEAFAAVLRVPAHGLNPHYAKVRDESRAWITQCNHGVYGVNMRAFMDNCSFELLAAYPAANELGLRAQMDLVNPPSCFI
jgi:hypothetical protein